MNELHTTDRLVVPIKPLKLRSVGTRHMLVENAPDKADLTYVYTLNASAAWLWQTVCDRPSTVAQLVSQFADHFHLSPAQAATDVQAQLNDWQGMGLISLPE